MNARALLRLARIPNVFTAIANVIAGAMLARGGALRACDLILAAASACLYLAGMVLNDFFDRDIDALERPERPIPSGEVTPGTALALGTALVGGGIGLAAWYSSTAGAVAAALACAILLYDGALKSSPLGPLAMGACRFLNVCLGLSVLGGAAPPERWMWIAPLTMGAYTTALTVLARDEVAGTSRARARECAALIGGVLGAALAALVVFSPASHLAGFLWLAPFAGFVAWQARGLLAPLVAEPSPATVGRAIGGGILLMPAIDAAMVAAGGWPEAAIWVLALSLPSMALKRWFYMT
jgi:4-hydroxybenzoate polyprenyltransferase